MPYNVGKDSRCPASKPYACRKSSDGKIMGCHESKEKAQAQQRALYAAENRKKK
jgi:hypothetical protein